LPEDKSEAEKLKPDDDEPATNRPSNGNELL